jgi:hypothetical protein
METDEEEVVWENERWGIDPMTRTARFGAEFLLLGERAQYVSKAKKMSSTAASLGLDVSAGAGGDFLGVLLE